MSAKTPGSGADPSAPELSLVARIAEAMLEAGEVTRDARNADANYDYASIEAKLAAVRGPLFERGIVLLQHPRDDLSREEIIDATDGARGVRAIIGYDFEFLDGRTDATLRIEGWTGEGVDYGDHAIAKARSNAISTFVRGQWLLPVKDSSDEDRSATTRRRSSSMPVWARFVRDDARKGELIAAIETLITAPVQLADGSLALPDAVAVAQRARTLAQSIADTFGGIPDGVVAALVAASKMRQALDAAAAAPAQEATDDLEPVIRPGAQDRDEAEHDAAHDRDILVGAAAPEDDDQEDEQPPTTAY